MIGPNLSGWAINARSLTLYFMLVAVIAGAVAFVGLGRDEDPTFTIKTMLVTAIWPGATIEETQNQLTDRLERRLQETTGLDSVRSITRPGVVTIYVDLDGTFPPDRVGEVWQEVRNSMGDIRHTLPQGVIGPFFNDDFGDVFGIVYAFTTDGFTHRELRDYVEDVRSALIRDVELIGKVEFIGAQDEEVTVELQPDRMASMGLDYGQVFAAIAAQNVVRPSGTINSGLENLSLRVSGSFENEAEILDVPINAGGRMIRLGDIAEVRRGFVDPPASLFRVNGKPAIGLGISMREGGDVLQLGKQVKASINRSIANLPIGIDTVLVSNQPDVVDVAIGDFTTSLYQAVGIILVVSFLTLGVRPGAVVAIAIPVTLATVFLVMQVMGIDLHRVSLGALIIALALLVDDAMTTVDATLRGLANGQTMEQASTSAYSKLAAPMLTGTLITIAGFVPIGFAESQAGEYTISLFQVVAIALIASWLVAVVFTPIIGSMLLKAPEKGASASEDSFLVRSYSRLLAFAIRVRWLTIALSFALLAVAFLAMARVDRQFFPPSDRNEIIIDFQLPRSSSIFASEAAVSKIEKPGWAQSEDVDFWSSYVGRNVIRFYLPLAILPPSDHHSQIVVMAKDLDARVRLEGELEKIPGRNLPGGNQPGQPAGNGPADRLAASMAPERSRRRDAAGQGLRPRGGDRKPSRRRPGPFRLDRAGAAVADRDQPGSGATTRPDKPEPVGDPADGRVRRPDHAAARRDLPGQRRGAGKCAATAFRSTISPRCRFLFRAAAPCPELVRHLLLRTGTASGLASRSRADPDGSGRCQGGHVPRKRRRRRRGGNRGTRRRSAARLRHRAWGDGRNQRREPGSRFRRHAVDDLHHGHAADDPAAKLRQHGPGDHVAAARPDRRGGGAPAVRTPPRLRRNSGDIGAHRHDREERGHPPYPDRGRAGERPGGAGCGRGRGTAACGPSC